MEYKQKKEKTLGAKQIVEIIIVLYYISWFIIDFLT